MKKPRSTLSILFTIFSSLALLCSNVAANMLLKRAEGPYGYPYIDAADMISSFNIRATIAKDGNIFTYEYTFSNPSTSTGMIESIDIDIHTLKGSVELSKDGLVNGPCLKDKGESEEVDMDEWSGLSPQEVKELFSVIPMGITAPSPWVCGSSVDTLAPSFGYTKTTILIFRVWDDNRKAYILPGQSLSGFQLTSRGLPSIRRFHAVPLVDQNEVEDMMDKANIAYDLGPPTQGVLGQTLAPTAPPTNFDPLVFIKTIHSYLAESKNLGWLKDEVLAAKLKGYLDNAAKAIPTGNTAVATQAIKAFIADLPEPPGTTKVCTAECSGLLVFNAQYLLDRLSTQPPLKKEK